MQRTDKKELRAITQDELVTFIHSIININNRTFPSGFDWNEQLKNAGFTPEFINIDFESVLNKLKESGSGSVSLIRCKANAVFSGIKFINCENIPFLANNKFINCDFDKCSIVSGDIRNCNYSHCMFKNVEFNHVTITASSFETVTINNCQFIDTEINKLTTNNSHITQCDIKSSRWTNVRGLVEDEYTHNTINFDCEFTNSAWDKIHDAVDVMVPEGKPLIVMLYSPEDGVTNALKMIKFYRSYDINLMLVTPNKGMNHPIFKKPHLISGIILPGGPDIPRNDQDVRKKFEIALLDLACEKKIPTLGICRGHQLIGSRFGGKIKTLMEHEEHVIHVKPKEGSLIYQRLDKKHHKLNSLSTEGQTPGPVYLIKDAKGKLTYLSACNHQQVLIFDKKRSNKESVKIVAKASDGVPEALQINDHIITYQHHHEAFLEADSPASTKIAKALLKQYIAMVKSYEEKNRHDKGLLVTPIKGKS